jgi:hypothetical protein
MGTRSRNARISTPPVVERSLISVTACNAIDELGSAFEVSLVIGGELAWLLRSMANEDPELPLTEAAEAVLDCLAHPLQPNETFALAELHESVRRAA